MICGCIEKAYIWVIELVLSCGIWEVEEDSKCTGVQKARVDAHRDSITIGSSDSLNADFGAV